MTQRMLAVAGLQLDRAWPEFDPPIGALLRQSSLGLLAEVVQIGMERECSHLLLVGDTISRETVRQETLELLSTALAAFPGTVLIVPGPRDWYDDSSPYALHGWPQNVEVFPTTTWSVLAGVAGSAWTERSTTQPPGETNIAPVAVRAADPGLVNDGVHVVTTGEAPPVETGARTVLLPVQRGPGQGHSALAVIEAGQDPRDVTKSFVSFSSASGSTHLLDMTDVSSTAELQDVLGDAVTRAQPLDVVRVQGRLQPGVLLPHYTGPNVSRDDVVVDWTSLEFTFEEPATEDRSVQAELVRALSRAPAAPAMRHQALALSLQALAADERA